VSAPARSLTAWLTVRLEAPGRAAGTWRALALVAVCLVLFLPGLFSLPPFDRDEARFAQATRQMLASGDYVQIRFQDEARNKKPVGIYWLQALAVTLSGTSVDTNAGSNTNGGEVPAIWPHRLPSLVGAILAVVLTGWAGSALFGPLVGWLGALMLAGCVVLGVEARMAKTDAVLLATVVAAQAVLARVYLGRERPERPGWGLTTVFWLALALGILIKGPIGPMVSGITVLALVLADRQGAWLARLRPLSGLLLVLLVAAPWLILIGIQTGGAFFTEAVGHDLLGKVASGQEAKGLPPGYYGATFFLTFWPFAFLTLLALPWLWRQRGEPAVRFCLAWIVPCWLVFEAVPTKLLHYTLPLFPAIALLTARAAVDHFGRTPERPCRRLFVVAAWLAVLVALALAAAFLALPWTLDGRDNLWSIVLAPLLLALIGYAVAAAWQRREGVALGLALAGAAVTYGIAYPAIITRIDALWVSRSAAAVVAASRPCPGTVVASAGYSEPSLVFLLGSATRLGSGASAAEHLRQDPACALALVEARQSSAFLQALGPLQPLALGLVGGFNYNTGRSVSLTLYRLPVPPSGADSDLPAGPGGGPAGGRAGEASDGKP